MITILLPAFSAAQDIHSSQFYNTAIFLNPAVAGTFDRNYRFMANYRNQWSSVTAPYVTMGGAFDMWFTKNKSVCGGLTFYNDKAGDSKFGTMQVNLLLSTVHQINKENLISGGIQAGYVQNSITYSGLTWDSQYRNGVYDPAASTNEPNNGSESFSFIDAGAGAYWMGKINNEFRMNAGLAAQHLSFPKYTFPSYSKATEKKDIRLNILGTAQYDLKNTNTSFLPGLLVQQQGKAREIVVGTLIKYTLGLTSRYTGAYTSSALYLGLHYRTGDALIAAVVFDYQKYFTAGVSYDFNISGLTPASNSLGGMEFLVHIPVTSQNQKTSVKLK